MRRGSSWTHASPTDSAFAAQHVQRVLQIGWVRADDLDPPAVCGMSERQRPRVQPLTFQPKPFRQFRVGSVDQVAAAWVMQRGEMHADLVGAAGFQVHIEQAGGGERFQGVVVGEAVPAVLK